MSKVETLEQLRDIYPEPKGRAVEKVLTRLEPHSRRFISLSPYCVLSTTGADGMADITPRGEAPGFVKVIDDSTLAIPDRPGNNRIDNLGNIVSNPAVGLLFMIPGVDEIFRVHGRAEIRDDDDLKAMFEVNGKRPATVLLVHVVEAYLHCAKALLRSDLWNPDKKVDRSELPSMGVMIRDQIGGSGPVEDQTEMIERYRKALY